MSPSAGSCFLPLVTLSNLPLGTRSTGAYEAMPIEQLNDGVGCLVIPPSTFSAGAGAVWLADGPFPAGAGWSNRR